MRVNMIVQQGEHDCTTRFENAYGTEFRELSVSLASVDSARTTHQHLADVIAAISQMVLIANDNLIAGILNKNRNGLVTGLWQSLDLRARHFAALASPNRGLQAN